MQIGVRATVGNKKVWWTFIGQQNKKKEKEENNMKLKRKRKKKGKESPKEGGRERD